MSLRQPHKRNRRLPRTSRASAAPNGEGHGEMIPQEAQRLQESLLDRIERGAKLCQELEAQLRQHPAPELETIIKLHRVLVLRLSADAQAVPALLQWVTALMKPVMDWARLEEKRRERELAEQKYREQAAARLAAKEKGQNSRAQALKPETLEKIERELNLF